MEDTSFQLEYPDQWLNLPKPQPQTRIRRRKCDEYQCKLHLSWHRGKCRPENLGFLKLSFSRQNSMQNYWQMRYTYIVALARLKYLPVHFISWEWWSWGKDGLALGVFVSFFGRAFSFVCWITQGKNDWFFVKRCHVFNDLLSKDATYGSGTNQTPSKIIKKFKISSKNKFSKIAFKFKITLVSIPWQLRSVPS